METPGPDGQKLSYDRFTQYFHYTKVAPLGAGDVLYISDINGQHNIWRQAISAGLTAGYQRMLTAFHDRTVRDFVLTPDEKWIYFMADQDGDERYQLYCMPSGGGEVTPLTSGRDVTHMLHQGAINRSGTRMLYSNNDRSRSDFDIVVRDLKTGKESRPLETGFLWADPVWDNTGQRFTAVQEVSNTDVRSFIYDYRKRKSVEIMPHEEESIVYASGWTRGGLVITVTDMDVDFRRLVLYDPVRGKRTEVYSGSHDVEAVHYSTATNKLFFAVNNEGYSELYECRPGAKPTRLRMRQKGWVGHSGISGDMKGKRIGMVWMRDAAPPELLVYDSPSRRSAYVTDSMAGGLPRGIPAPRLIHYDTFDGRKVPAFYYAPVGHLSKFPAVLSIHGGPEAQERPSWAYSGFYQFLQMSGIAVLSPNVRGSTGYGKRYQKLIHRDWGGDELKDFEYAAKWLISRKDIDGDRMAVIGASFGGFATLSCVARLPSYWKAGVDVCGPSNLVTFCRSVPPFWLRFMKDWVGDPETESDFLMERSPITYIDNVRADMLIMQGANDPRVVKAESDQMVERLRSIGRNVDYMVFEDEGHEFTKVANVRKSFNRCSEFIVSRLSR